MKSEVLGYVLCGFPSPGVENKDEELDFNEFLLKHPSCTYCLRARGTSMEPLIQEGDVLVTDRSLRPKNGDVIIAEVDGCFTAKRLVFRQDVVRLVAENPDYEDIKVFGELISFGVVTAIVRQLRRN